MEGRTLVLRRHEEKIIRALELAGCYVVTTDVLKESMSAQEVHDSYVSLQKVERDFRALKTGLLALKLRREMERRLREKFGTTDSDPARAHVARCSGRAQ